MPVPGLFSVLLEREEGTPRCALEEEYGAPLLVGAGRVAVNFVSTIDGVVSLGMDSDDSRAVGGGVAADRTLMAMLRAVAGVIVVGAGTPAGHPQPPVDGDRARPRPCPRPRHPARRRRAPGRARSAAGGQPERRASR